MLQTLRDSLQLNSNHKFALNYMDLKNIYTVITQ